MSAGERILLQALGEWSLWNTEGKLIGTRAVTASSMVLDPSGGLFFGADHAGLIVARRLEDGQPAFSMGLTFGRNFSAPSSRAAARGCSSSAWRWRHTHTHILPS